MRDGMGFQRLREAGYKTGIITKENSGIVEQRAAKLKVEALFLGIENKLATIQQFAKKNDIQLDQIAYIGDDVNDTELLNVVGFSAAPADAIELNRKAVDFVCTLNGGAGAFREFAEVILSRKL
jgi:YrbI family 3-deoxy-D-manno-octulosonate 8-phosphate phosphatase